MQSSLKKATPVTQHNLLGDSQGCVRTYIFVTWGPLLESPENFSESPENFSAPGVCFSKVSKLFGRISGAIILFVSSKRRRLEARNFAVIFIYIPFTTYEKTSFTE